MYRLVRRTWFLAVPVLAACAPRFQGTVNGLTLDARDTIFVVQQDATSGTISSLSILISDRPGACAAVQANAFQRDSTLLEIILHEKAPLGQGTWTTPTTGDYAVYANEPRFALVHLLTLDASCQLTSSAAGKLGVVTLDAYSAEPGGTLTGSFDITFGPAGDEAKGSLDATFCDGVSLGSGCQ